MMSLSLYRAERSDKGDFLNLNQVKQMNENLQAILMNLPEGVILLEKESQKVKLINQEYKRIFGMCPEVQAHDSDIMAMQVRTYPNKEEEDS